MTSTSRPFDGFDDDTDNSGGGSGGGPYDGPGDIRLNTGNFTAVGDGVNTGRIIGQTIEAQSGNIINNLIVENGNLNLNNGGVNAGSGDGEFFEVKIKGSNILKISDNPVSESEYCQSKGCAFLPSTNLFTATNTFQQDIVLSGVGKSVVNSQGSFVSATSDIETMVCGSVDCSNGGFNSVKAKEVNFRVGTETNGFKIRQESATDPLGSYLQVQGGSAGDSITIIDNAHSIAIPSIELDPQTQVIGGKITANQYNIGFGTQGFLLNQPRSGVDVDNLRIMCGVNNGVVRFQNFGGSVDLARIEQNSVDGSGRIYCPAIFFGVSGVHNSISNDISGNNNLNLNIRQATASSEVLFLDNTDAEIIRVRKEAVELGTGIPIYFDNFVFRPQQFYKDINNFSFNHSILGATNLLFNTGNPAVQEWTNVNTTATNQPIDLINNAGAYKITIRQTSAGALGEINGLYVMSDIVLSRPNDNAPDVELAQPTAYSFNAYDGQSPVITMKPGFLTWAVHCTFPQVSNNETANIRITLTQMPYF